MIRWKGTRAPRVLAVCALLAAGACRSSTGFDVDGVRIYGLDAGNNLVEFGSRSPDKVRRREIRGLQEGEVLVGIDYRAGDTRLVGLGSTSRLYVIDTNSTTATPVAGPFVPALEGEAFGVDFEPATGSMRVLGSGGQNLRLDPNGVVSSVDAAPGYLAGDPGAITTPRIAAAAYAPGSPSALYAIDSNRDVLVIIPTPGNGQVATVGSLGLNTSDDAGFDIVDTTEGQKAYAVLSEGRISRLYEVDLSTGALEPLGRLATRTAVRSITVIQGQDEKP